VAVVNKLEDEYMQKHKRKDNTASILLNESENLSVASMHTLGTMPVYVRV